MEIPGDSEQVLIFSFVGMKTQEIAVGSKTQLDVKLVEDSETLDDVVVTGIFTKSKESYGRFCQRVEDVQRSKSVSHVA